jgi:predicted nuclease of restriction endonuclease-like RecB superfamily
MLKLPHVQARLKIERGRASVKQMEASSPEDHQRAAEVLAIFRQALADRLTRDALYARLSAYSGVRLDYREIDGLAKTICDSFATFEGDRGVRGELSAISDQPSAIGGQDGEDTESNEDEREVESRGDEVLDEEDEASTPDVQPLTPFRLAVWKEAARPENYSFEHSGLALDLKPGVQNLRRAAAAYDAELLANLLPLAKRVEILQKAAGQVGYTLVNVPEDDSQIGQLLFADLPGRHRLVALSDDLNVENLLNRYNVELLRGVLYLAPRLRIVVRDRYKDIFKYIKLFGLMHEVKPLPKAGVTRPKDAPLTEGEIGGYEILLEGAASPFLARSDRRYGLQFAKFLPALLLCEDEWELEAELVLGWGPRPGQEKQKAGSGIVYRLGPQPHLRTHFKGSGQYDSLLEESLAVAFEKRFKTTSRTPVSPAPVEVENEAAPKKGRKRKPPRNPEERQGWTIRREDRIINVFDTVMLPDFAFEHSDGRRALLEIVGFWEPGYLERKIAKLNRAGRSDIIVLVSERTRCGREHFQVKGQDPAYPLIFFKGTPRLGPIMEALERCAVPASTLAE